MRDYKSNLKNSLHSLKFASIKNKLQQISTNKAKIIEDMNKIISTKIFFLPI
jgi:hypothetical protein